MRNSIYTTIAIAACAALIEGCSAAGGSAIPTTPTLNSASIASTQSQAAAAPIRAAVATIACPPAMEIPCSSVTLLKGLTGTFADDTVHFAASYDLTSHIRQTRIDVLSKDESIELAAFAVPSDPSCNNDCVIVASTNQLEAGVAEAAIVSSQSESVAREGATRQPLVSPAEDFAATWAPLPTGIYYFYVAKRN